MTATPHERRKLIDWLRSDAERHEARAAALLEGDVPIELHDYAVNVAEITRAAADRIEFPDDPNLTSAGVVSVALFKLADRSISERAEKYRAAAEVIRMEVSL